MNRLPILLALAFLASTSGASAVALRLYEPPACELPASYDCPEWARPVIEREAERAGIPEWFLAAVCREESGFIAGAVGVNADGSCDRGFFQFSDTYIDWYADNFNGGRAFDPHSLEESAPVAARALAYFVQQDGALYGAACAWNCGLPRVLRGAIPERTARYGLRVLGI